jgi:hypothetical protein
LAANLKPLFEAFAGTALRAHPLSGTIQYAVKLPAATF